MRMRHVASTLVAIASLAWTVLPANAVAPAHVTGAQRFASPSDPCFDPSALFSLSMEGGLVGCWWIDTADDQFHPSGTVLERGTEHFTGCIDEGLDGACGADDPWGTFWTTYIFTAKFTPDFAEIHGRCGHRIVSGADGFAGATGFITFHDDVTSGIAYYRGTVKLVAVSAQRTANARSTSSRLTSTTMAC
jgi:hypothetical protein